ncbi:hypothetical protein QY97_02039 [Bacillus thermotolerans]|uniref:Uncharacterized protein n=1 Tax=Bacillus thermotolerans TaxID=1221996 RepID=A0A0F5HQ68_BACTR|nr:hypothetical protein QY97_02039 [Bacillus thermotolerans]KKB40596.1 hypothetical protein QY96_02332 [Bacillus thermotolerans]KKB41932.1 hypothetical protein QY95_00440 [Bacillus thermotolerans]
MLLVIENEKKALVIICRLLHNKVEERKRGYILHEKYLRNWLFASSSNFIV